MTDERNVTVLEAENITVGYGALKVIQNVSFRLTGGEFMSLIGPNGAGKTTLLGALGGQLPIQHGHILYNEERIERWRGDRRARAGIGRSFQAIHLFPNLTAAEHIRLAIQGKRRFRFRDYMGSVAPTVDAQVADQLEQVGLSHVAHQPACELSHGDKRKLELSMLLATEPQVLLLDEPTAGMSLAEAPTMLNLIADLKATGRYAILLVEHKMDVVMRLSDRVLVLHQGQLLLDGSPSEVMASPEVAAAYLGGHHGSIA